MMKFSKKELNVIGLALDMASRQIGKQQLTANFKEEVEISGSVRLLMKKIDDRIKNHFEEVEEEKRMRDE